MKSQMQTTEPSNLLIISHNQGQYQSLSSILGSYFPHEQGSNLLIKTKYYQAQIKLSNKLWNDVLQFDHVAQTQQEANEYMQLNDDEKQQDENENENNVEQEEMQQQFQDKQTNESNIMTKMPRQEEQMIEKGQEMQQEQQSKQQDNEKMQQQQFQITQNQPQQSNPNDLKQSPPTKQSGTLFSQEILHIPQCPSSLVKYDFLIMLVDESSDKHITIEHLDQIIEKYNPQEFVLLINMKNPSIKWLLEDQIVQKCNNFIEIIKENLKKLKQNKPEWKGSGLLSSYNDQNYQQENQSGIFSILDRMQTTRWTNLTNFNSNSKSKNIINPNGKVDHSIEGAQDDQEKEAIYQQQQQQKIEETTPKVQVQASAENEEKDSQSIKKQLIVNVKQKSTNLPQNPNQHHNPELQKLQQSVQKQNSLNNNCDTKGIQNVSDDKKGTTELTSKQVEKQKQNQNSNSNSNSQQNQNKHQKQKQKQQQKQEVVDSGSLQQQMLQFQSIVGQMSAFRMQSSGMNENDRKNKAESLFIKMLKGMMDM